MKRHFLSMLLFAFLLTGLPLLPAMLIRPAEEIPAAAPVTTAETTDFSTIEPTEVENTAVYHVLDTETGEIKSDTTE